MTKPNKRRDYLESILNLQKQIGWVHNNSAPLLVARLETDIKRLRQKIIAYELRE